MSGGIFGPSSIGTQGFGSRNNGPPKFLGHRTPAPWPRARYYLGQPNRAYPAASYYPMSAHGNLGDDVIGFRPVGSPQTIMGMLATGAVAIAIISTGAVLVKYGLTGQGV